MGTFTRGKQKAPIRLPLERLGIVAFATQDEAAARAFIARASLIKCLTPDQLKAVFYLRAIGAGVSIPSRGDCFALTMRERPQSLEFLATGLEAFARKNGMTDAVVCPIRFMPEFFERLADGSKVETRRFSESWNTVQAGDVLRVLSTSPAAKELPVFRVVETRRERLQLMDEEGARREGFRNLAEFRALWDRLYRKEASRQWEANPEVRVIRFLEDQSAIVEALS